VPPGFSPMATISIPFNYLTSRGTAASRSASIKVEPPWGAEDPSRLEKLQTTTCPIMPVV